jgi:hypothetical protein
MTKRQLTIAAVVLIIALTPSVTDLAQAHQENHPSLPLLWGWVALAAVVALLAGEELMSA